MPSGVYDRRPRVVNAPAVLAVRCNAQVTVVSTTNKGIGVLKISDGGLSFKPSSSKRGHVYDHVVPWHRLKALIQAGVMCLLIGIVTPALALERVQRFYSGTKQVGRAVTNGNVTRYYEGTRQVGRSETSGSTTRYYRGTTQVGRSTK